jgi:hypothetical protein
MVSIGPLIGVSRPLVAVALLRSIADPRTVRR